MTESANNTISRHNQRLNLCIKVNQTTQPGMKHKPTLTTGEVGFHATTKIYQWDNHTAKDKMKF